MNKERIKTFLLDFKKKKLSNVRKRELTLGNTLKIQTIIGARRTGKTYLLYNKILELEERGVSRNRMIYLNFENPIIDDVSYKEIKDIIELHWQIFPEIINKKFFLFIDEPQVIDKWESAIRSIYDDFNISIFLTGSSSRLLSKEIATSLRGRSLTTVLLPLSFNEFLSFKNFSFDLNKLNTPNKVKIKKYFDEFLQFGSYPEIVLEDDNNEKIKIAKDYFDLTVYKDIIDRYNIKNTNLIKLLIDLIISSCSKEFSINKHFLDLKSRGLKLAKNTLYEYFSALEDSFFVFPLKRFYHSKKSENLSIPKVYLGDVGFLNLFSLDNFGQRFENIIFLDILRKKNKNHLLKINYWRSDRGGEVDFVLSQGGKVKTAIQACFNLNDLDTKKREIKGLQMCMEELKLKEGIIITNDFEAEEKIKDKKIKFIPAWKWLLLDSNDF